MGFYVDIVYPDGTRSDGGVDRIPEVAERWQQDFIVLEVKEVPLSEDNKDPDGNRIVDYEIRLGQAPKEK